MKTTHRTRALALAVALAACAGAAQAELYKWTDANGVINYSNLPPMNARVGAQPVIIDNLSVIPSPRVSPTLPETVDERMAIQQQASMETAVPNVMTSHTSAIEMQRYYGDANYYPPRVTYTPTIRRASERAQRYEMDPVPYYGIGAPEVIRPQPVRYREVRR